MTEEEKIEFRNEIKELKEDGAKHAHWSDLLYGWINDNSRSIENVKYTSILALVVSIIALAVSIAALIVRMA